MDQVRIPVDKLVAEYARVLSGKGMPSERAALCGRLFAETDRDGVYTHGLRRFAGFVRGIETGRVDPKAEPVRVGGFGAVEQWDGRRGPGNLLAYACMERAMELARQHGMGCVGLRNGNHWFRAGTYGWQAAQAGFIAMCWTNTIPNLPPWGAKEPRLGNNPFVMAVPRAAGHVVLDMAMSQFSWGKLDQYAAAGRELPVDGGYDADGRPSRSARAILDADRALPIGMWKGAGMALLLDLTATLLSAGSAVWQQGQSAEKHGPSQVFIAVSPDAFGAKEAADQTADQIVEFMLAAEPAGPGEKVYYPGQRTLMARQENLRLGIPVDAKRWQQVLEM